MRGFGWEIAHAAVTRRPPISFHTVVPWSGNYARVRRWDLGLVHHQGPLSVAACRTLALRFATCSVAAGDGARGHRVAAALVAQPRRRGARRKTVHTAQRAARFLGAAAAAVALLVRRREAGETTRNGSDPLIKSEITPKQRLN